MDLSPIDQTTQRSHFPFRLPCSLRNNGILETLVAKTKTTTFALLLSFIQDYKRRVDSPIPSISMICYTAIIRN